MPWEGRGTGVITPEACVTVCLAVLEVIPDKAERTRRGTSCQVAGGFEERASRCHPARTLDEALDALMAARGTPR